jgi:peptide/nickel transport system substrate-binding protein
MPAFVLTNLAGLRDRDGSGMMACMRTRLRYLAPALVVGLTLAAGCAQSGGGPAAPPVAEFPRHETLFTGGTQWGPPSSWNPIQGGGQAMGVQGLLYETPFVFDPWTLELEPWLAERGEWVSDTVYELTLREGIEWSDGTPMTSADVVFTVELGRIPEVPYSTLFEWLDTVEAVDELTTRFTFSDPRRGQWDNWLSNNQIVPAHLWSEIPDDEIMSFANDQNPIGSGPYLYHSHDDDRMVWQRNENWWGTEALGLEMKPTYIIDLVNPSNEVAFGQIVQNQLDISNFFLPGIQEIVGEEFGVSTYYPEEPYMLSANTAYLIPNHTRPPLDDAAFRRALAFSIDVDTIVENVYGGIVQAADPTGLLPTWEEFVDPQVVAEYGFRYDPGEARRILAEAGYVDLNGDGFVETPTGDEIVLTLIVPAGWTDWNEAAQVIAGSARGVGINLLTDFPEAATLDDLRNSGEFDLVINNWTELNNTPWTNYRYLFQLPIQDIQPNQNFARYENPQAWELTQELARLSVGETGFQEVISQLQQIALVEMPAIPMWYNGAWSQVNNNTWTNWPSAQEGTPDHYPVTWGGYFEKGAIYMFAEIEPAG